MIEILKTQILRGPNIWSSQVHQLIQTRVQIKELQTQERKHLLHLLEDLPKSETFYKNSDENSQLKTDDRTEFCDTQIPVLFAQVALRFQQLAGMQVTHLDMRKTSSDGIFNIVFEYEIEEVGRTTVDLVTEFFKCVEQGSHYNVQQAVDELRLLSYSLGPGEFVQHLEREARLREIPVALRENEIILGYGKYRRTLRTKNYDEESRTADFRKYSHFTQPFLEDSGIPVPEKTFRSDLAEKAGFIGENHQNRTDQITTNGRDFRLLVVGGKLLAAAEFTLKVITGNGHSSVQQLIDKFNDLESTFGDENYFKIAVGRETYLQLENAGLRYESIPENGQNIHLISCTNTVTNADAKLFAEKIHPANRFLAERIAAMLELDFCSVEIKANDLAIPLAEHSGEVIFVNADPIVDFIRYCDAKSAADISVALIDALFPAKPAKVPIIAITGTNGKTTTTRLLAHISRLNGSTPGYTTTDGVYLKDFKIQSGDSSGPLSAALILRDPMIDLAVLETARGGILRSGLAFEKCDIAVVTNIQEDHLGLADIDTLEDLAEVKTVVARSVKDSGTIVLNADDPLCVHLALKLICKITWFSLNSENFLVLKHIDAGGTAVILENNEVVVYAENQKFSLGAVTAMPLSLNGTAKFMIANLLAATGVAYAQNIGITEIKNALESFIPTFELSPGRMNLFELQGFHVLIDYAHNAHGLLGMKDYLQHVQAARKIGVITAVGDRKASDIRRNASIAAEMFDHVIIRLERDLRGRTGAEINELIISGLALSEHKITYELITDEAEAVLHALTIAQAGDFVVIFSEDYKKIAALIRERQSIETEATRDAAIDHTSSDAV